MKTDILIYSEDLAEEDIGVLLQAIRDCEQKSLRDKQIGITVFVPALTLEELAKIINGVATPFNHGPHTSSCTPKLPRFSL